MKTRGIVSKGSNGFEINKTMRRVELFVKREWFTHIKGRTAMNKQVSHIKEYHES